MNRLRSIGFKALLSRGRKMVTHALLQRQLPPLLEQLSSLLYAGVPLKQALLHLHETPMHRVQAAYVQAMLTALEDGRSLSSVWSTDLPPLFVVLFQAGEKTGELPAVFSTWSHFANERQAWTAKLLRMSAYPSLLLTLSILLLLFLLHVVLPTFLNMYRELGLTLPASTQILFGVLRSLPVFTLGLSAFGALFGGVLHIVLVRYPSLGQQIVSHIPGHRLIQLQRTRVLCLLLAILLDAGIPVADCFHVLSTAAGPRWLRDVSPDIKRNVLNGEPLHKAFAGNWDPLLFVLLRWAEQTGDLVQALRKVEGHVRELFTSRVKTAFKVFEPTLVLCMGAFVGSTMLAVFVPMYDLISQVTAVPLR